MPKKFSSFLIALCLVVSGTQAQQKWSLEDCIQYARDHNISLKIANLNVTTEEYTLKQKKLNLLPTLNGDASYSYNFGRVVDPTTYTFVTGKIQTNTFSLSSGVTLFSGFQQQNSIKQQSLKLQSSRWGVKATAENLEINIAEAYLQVLLARENVTVATEQLNASKAQLELTRKLVDAGTVAEGDLLEIQAKVANDNLVLVNARNTADQAILNLKLMLNLPPGSDFDILEPQHLEEDISLMDLGSLEDIIARATANRPTVKKAEYDLMAAERGVAAAKGSYSPRLTLFGSLHTNYSDNFKQFRLVPKGFDTIGTVAGTGAPVIANFMTYETQKLDYPYSDQLSNNFNQTYGISLTIPIFNGFQARSTVETARVQQQIAQLNLEQAHNDLVNTIQQIWSGAVAAQAKYEAARDNLESMTKAFDYIKIKAEQGMVSSLDYITAQNNYHAARANMLSAKYEFLFRKLILDYYQGKALLNLN